jgi:signal transduction histidine kinase
MAALPTLMRRPTIASRLAAWFLLIALIPCGILTFLLYVISSFQIDQATRRNYLVIAESKTAQLEALAKEKIRSVEALSRSPTIVDATTSLAAAFSTTNLGAGRASNRAKSPTVGRLTAQYRNSLSLAAHAYHYQDFFLVAPSGQTLYNMNDPRAAGEFINEGPLRDSELANVFNRAKTLVQAEISDFQTRPGQNEPVAFVAGPVMSGQSVVGVMIFRLNNEEIYGVHGILRTYLGLGETGDITVGSKVADGVMIVAPGRNDEGASFFRKIPLQGNEESPLFRAVRGEHGYGQFTDDRGHDCRGFWTYVPQFRWGLVVKQDSSEALAFIEIQRRTSLFLLCLTIVPVIVAAFLIARSITRPIQVAARTAQRVAAGDLTAEFKIGKMDETGQLLLAIRSMTAKLRDHHETMEQRIRQRTRELEESNRELLAAREVAEDANRAKTAFLANMSHELRTPMNAIIGYTEMVIEESREANPAGFAPDLERILSAARHLLVLINDILDLSKIEAGKTELFLETIDIKALMAEVGETITPLAAGNRNQIEVSCPGSIGLMRADPTKVRQALYNLLSNACKFTREGRVSAGVRSEVRSDVDWIEFVVTDTGIGISPDQLTRLFQPFSQADASTTRKYGGTGLGLAITRRFARMMGGDVLVRSELGRGATFTLVLPRQVMDPKAASASAPSPEPAPRE